jgi:hypothetical protein
MSNPGYTSPTMPLPVALVFDRKSDTIVDRTYGWETAESMTLEGYVCIAVRGDGPFESATDLTRALMKWAEEWEDCWGQPRWRPTNLWGTELQDITAEDYCLWCERGGGLHYDSCDQEQREPINLTERRRA